jgi:SAM-dependent methyltransferase
VNHQTSGKRTGYVTDIPYTFRYQRELSPSLHWFAITGLGYQPGFHPLGSITYTELGCGYGLSLLIHAAGHPDSQFIGVDFIPEHIAAARRIAKAAGLTNVEFIETSFADLKSRNVPRQDVIALHGVWSWVDNENRGHILNFIDRCLKPSGVLYLSYNTLPGLAPVMGLREIMVTGFNRAQGTTLEKVEAAIRFAEDMRAAGAGFFAANPRAGQMLDRIKTLSRVYLAHEYFNADWWPFYHAQVADALRPLGLNYAASAHVLDNIEGLNLSATAQDRLAQTTDRTEREGLKDYFMLPDFRRDLYFRGTLQQVDNGPLLHSLRFAVADSPAAIDSITLTTSLGQIRPRRASALPILTAMQSGPASAIELMRNPACAGMGIDEIFDTLLVLCALGAADPAMPAHGQAARKARTDKLNEVLWELSLQDDSIHACASPVTGGGVGVERVEQFFLLARARGQEPAAFLKAAFGGAVQGDIAGDYARFVANRLPALNRLGIG